MRSLAPTQQRSCSPQACTSANVSLFSFLSCCVWVTERERKRERGRERERKRERGTRSWFDVSKRLVLDYVRCGNTLTTDARDVRRTRKEKRKRIKNEKEDRKEENKKRERAHIQQSHAYDTIHTTPYVTPYIQHHTYNTIRNTIHTTPHIQHHTYNTIHTTPHIQHHTYNTIPIQHSMPDKTMAVRSSFTLMSKSSWT